MSANFDENDLLFVQKAERYCATDEQCRSAVRAKLLVWGASWTQVDTIIRHLCDNDFINEERFANLYCNSKLRFQKWGRIKISYQLRDKQISKDIIKKALESIDPEVYRSVILSLAETKWATLSAEADWNRRKNKLFSFLASKGFESEEIIDTLVPAINDWK